MKIDRRRPVLVGGLGAFIDLPVVGINRRAAALVYGCEQVMRRHADEHHRSALLNELFGAVDEHGD